MPAIREKSTVAATEPEGVLWDVIVVGGGPAGSSAARVAAANGARVLLIDRASFPRYKTCGGGLVGESLALIPDEVLATVEQHTTEVRFSRSGKSRVHRVAQAEFLHLVQRESFDEALVEAAIRAGVTFAQNVKLKSIVQPEPGAVSLETSAGQFRTKFLIGADGTNGRCGPYVGVEAAGIDLALEHEIKTPASAAQWASSVFLDWGADAGTYAWVFPKRDLLTVGVIQAKGAPERTRDYLERWTASLGLDAEPIVRTTGHLTQWRSPHSPLRRGSVVVAGDAAALLDPFTREGISFALRSGTWAGEACAREASGIVGALDEYERRVLLELAPEIRAGERMLRFFERHPNITHRMLGSAVGSKLFIRVCRGETSLARILGHRGVRAALRVFGA